MLNLTAEERDYITDKLIERAISIMDLGDLESSMSIVMRESIRDYDEYSHENLWVAFMNIFSEFIYTTMRKGIKSITGYDEYSDEDLWDTFMDTFDELWEYADDSKKWDHRAASKVLKAAHKILN